MRFYKSHIMVFFIQWSVAVPLKFFMYSFSVLPHYKIAETDEFDEKDGQSRKLQKGELETLPCEKNQENMGGLAISLPHGAIMFECALLGTIHILRPHISGIFGPPSPPTSACF